MENICYVQKILNYFASMDIDGLRMHLKDCYSYQETSKEIFLDALEKAFKSIRLKNSSLIISSGKCCSESCTNKRNKGYRFIANKTRDYLDLIFNIKDDDIRDIYSCGEFCSDENVSEPGNQCSISINFDDRIDFYKSDLYFQKVELATNAINEIVFEPHRPIDFEKLESWLHEHRFTIDLIGDYDVFAPRMKWTAFLHLYEELKEINNFIKNNAAEIHRAKLDFEASEEERQWIDWILRYKSLVKNAPLLWNYVYKKEEDCYEKIETEQPLRLNGPQFLECFDFLKNYEKKQNELLDKYNALSLEEEMEIMQSDPERDFAEIFTLSFHLERRATLRQYGMELGFYLRGEF